jgi:flagellar basal-body rod protein FlgF
MVYGIYQSAAGMQVNQYRQDVLANNLANVATTGFKPDFTVVKERLQALREDGADPGLSADHLSGLTGGSLVAPTYTSFAAGPIEVTGNPLDVAISRDGFFAVKDGDTTRYTRDGRFVLDDDGQLVTAAGHHPVLSDAGAPISVPPRAAGKVRIDGGGRLRAGTTSFGRIGTVRFADTGNLRKIGGNLIEAFEKPISTDEQLHSGAIEASAVDPTQSMVSMIEVSRAYQLNATMVGLADTTLGRAVNDIARLK